MFSGGSQSWQRQPRLSGKCIPGPGWEQKGFPWQGQRVRLCPEHHAHQAGTVSILHLTHPTWAPGGQDQCGVGTS